MKEINDIVQSYQIAKRNNLRMALATVVKVQGSSYRQPGARMLITEDGILTGAISGGCLEGDALRKALLAIHQQQNKLITYDTSNEDDAEFGVQLGCNGVVHILFEFVDINNPNNPVTLLKRLQDNRKEAVIVTLFSMVERNAQRGTVLIANEAAAIFSLSPDLDSAIFLEDIRLAKEKKQTFLRMLVFQNLQMEALIEYIAPVVTFVIVGAGNDVKPLVEIVSILGWETIVIDGRATHALPQRFPKARQVIISKADQAVSLINVDLFTVFVLMTHNYQYDLTVLKSLARTVTPYIGVLGPKAKLEHMFIDLEEAGITIDEMQKERIHGPMGLDIGAETSEEIAISIVAEIKAVLSGRAGNSLKLLTTRIHEDIPFIP